METRLKLGVVGFGRRGRSLFGLATHAFRVEAAAVCDSAEANLRAAEQAYPEARVFSTFERMLDEVKLDALLVETPATFHAELCARALARDIHVMSDVPAVATLDEAQDLWRAQQASRALYMFGANPNMWGFVDAAVDLVKKGVLGQPYYMEAELPSPISLREGLRMTLPGIAAAESARLGGQLLRIRYPWSDPTAEVANARNA